MLEKIESAIWGLLNILGMIGIFIVLPIVVIAIVVWDILGKHK